MKELSIEEKAKRYDEAIEKARIWKDKSGMPKDKQGILDDIFPELRESEDERMKSAAIEFVIQNKSFNYYLGISKDDVVTWINRQGEQKAWTEEDKNMLKWVIGYLENKMLNTPISEERTACKNAIDWLKDLIERVQSQNLTVTDEEIAQAKKDAYNDALDKIEYHSGEPTFDDGWSAAIGYIQKKSLRPQSQWKPSDEQMNLLEELVEDNNQRYFYTILRSLYEQLKKLKG